MTEMALEIVLNTATRSLVALSFGCTRMHTDLIVLVAKTIKASSYYV